MTLPRQIRWAARRVANDHLPYQGSIAHYGAVPVAHAVRMGREGSAGISYDNEGNFLEITSASTATGYDRFLFRESDLGDFEIEALVGRTARASNPLWVQTMGEYPRAYLVQDVDRNSITNTLLATCTRDVRTPAPFDFNLNNPVSLPSATEVAGVATAGAATWTLRTADAGNPPIRDFMVTLSAQGASTVTRIIPYQPELTITHTPGTETLEPIGSVRFYIDTDDEGRTGFNRMPDGPALGRYYGSVESAVEGSWYGLRPAAALTDTRVYRDSHGVYGLIILGTVDPSDNSAAPLPAPTNASANDRLRLSRVILGGTIIEIVTAPIGTALTSTAPASASFELTNAGQGGRRVAVPEPGDPLIDQRPAANYTQVMYRPIQGASVENIPIPSPSALGIFVPEFHGLAEILRPETSPSGGPPFNISVVARTGLGQGIAVAASASP